MPRKGTPGVSHKLSDEWTGRVLGVQSPSVLEGRMSSTAGARYTERPARASSAAKKPSRFESSGAAYATTMANAWLGRRARRVRPGG